MEWVETTGRTLEQAKDAALDQLGVDEEDAEFEVVEQGRGALFGLLRGEARVRARVRPTAPRAKVDRRDRRRRDRSQRVSAAAKPARAQQEMTNARDDGGDAVSEEVPVAEQAEMARDFVGGLLDAFAVDADVTLTVDEEEEVVEVGVEGDELGLLIGPRGQTLSAVTELARTVIQRRVPGHHARLTVDVAGYRQKRREALERFVTQMAEEVRSSGTRRVLEPMTAPDRKVVHDTVNSLDGVSTTSEGEEPRRRVVILPEGDL
jgi:spoIIIJ-associated protein